MLSQREQALDRRLRIHRQATGEIEGMNLINKPYDSIVLLTGFQVNGQGIGPGLFERTRERARIGQHEVGIELEVSDTANGLDDGQAKAEIGHEVAIHDIEMKQVGASLLNSLNLVFEPREVSGQQRWGDLNIPIGHP
jgi:hypothetical protein